MIMSRIASRRGVTNRARVRCACRPHVQTDQGSPLLTLDAAPRASVTRPQGRRAVRGRARRFTQPQTTSSRSSRRSTVVPQRPSRSSRNSPRRRARQYPLISDADERAALAERTAAHAKRACATRALRGPLSRHAFTAVRSELGRVLPPPHGTLPLGKSPLSAAPMCPIRHPVEYYPDRPSRPVVIPVPTYPYRRIHPCTSSLPQLYLRPVTALPAPPLAPHCIFLAPINGLF
ncbi:hypothetical protein EXIGLDRAFT_114105 [Exidia glandulosa HHB12029]|uniref:Uncharacterized protein n=1 Tax=Exidia glandulosa HHB12029 TaxID=1314781 RepID=A0A165GMI1_EXIGL|nr:hypothetical protein EXIGLDRAFT_114105 [Exidia glandulosa HHB12029]